MGRGRRQKVVWDQLTSPIANLPLLILDNANLGRDGAFTGVHRWLGADVTLLRLIFQSMCRVTFLDFPVDPTTVLELCVGISSWDSSGDLDGQGVNTTMVAGTGPLSDANNSRWMARCCVVIPLGSAATLAATETVVLPTRGPRNGPGTGYSMWIGNSIAANQRIHVYCEWDSRTKRTLRGSETEWLNVALEAATSTPPAVGDDITISMDHFGGRVVKTSGGLADV